MAASSVPVVLSILRTEDHYGYQILKKVKEASGGTVEWADGMLYPVLHKLEEKGLIASYWQTSPEGRKRKYYSIKKEGQEVLQEAQNDWDIITLLLKNLWQPGTI